MSVIVVQELTTTTLQQEFEVVKKMRTHLGGIRLGLYKHKDPVGTFICRVKKGATVLVEKTLTSSQINLLGGFSNNEHQHGVFLFEFDKPIILNKNKYII